jgi:hypothetical protein
MENHLQHEAHALQKPSLDFGAIKSGAASAFSLEIELARIKPGPLPYQLPNTTLMRVRFAFRHFGQRTPEPTGHRVARVNYYLVSLLKIFGFVLPLDVEKGSKRNADAVVMQRLPH